MKEQTLILAYFITTAIVGTAALSIPTAWNGDEPLKLIDAAFTATSAVCVTGLITVDTAQFSLFGKTIIMALIQAGGLGIITFATLLLLVPGRKISFNNRRMIKNFYVEGVDYDPIRIVRNILIFTFSFEILGTIILGWQFGNTPHRWFTALFHSISAFCNAGFSTFTTSLEGWNDNPLILISVAALIFTGGISFVVIHDISDSIRNKRPKLSLHSKVVLMVSLFLIVSCTLFFWVTDLSSQDSSLSPVMRIVNALFHAVTPRTAGFNSLPMDSLSETSLTLTLFMMFIGGAPGSMAGGIKVTSFFLVLLGILRGIDEKGDSMFLHHRISAKTISHAGMFIFKALFLVAVSSTVLLYAERDHIAAGDFSFFHVIFETVSAFGTVGLSLGITSSLSILGKLILIITMFLGRVGLVFMASKRINRHRLTNIKYPHGEVLTG